MRLNTHDANELAARFVDGTATAADVRTAVAIVNNPGDLLLTLHDAHILATYTTEGTRRWEHHAREGHMQTAMAMQDEGGSIYDIDDAGAPVRFTNWRQLVKIENDPMWGNEYIGPFAERGNV